MSEPEIPLLVYFYLNLFVPYISAMIACSDLVKVILEAFDKDGIYRRGLMRSCILKCELTFFYIFKINIRIA